MEKTSIIVGGQRNNYEMQSESKDIDGEKCWVFYPKVGNENEDIKIYCIGESWVGRLHKPKKTGGEARWAGNMPICRQEVTLLYRSRNEHSGITSAEN